MKIEIEERKLRAILRRLGIADNTIGRIIEFLKYYKIDRN